jgi:hypothetical protein
VVLILAVLVQTDFIMDDTNSNISYVGPWSRQDIEELNSSQVFNGTMYVVVEPFIASLLIIYAV